MELRDKKITIVGLGNSGINAALLAKREGAAVRATDSGDSPELKKTKVQLESNGIEVEIGGHTAGFIKGQDLVVVSPGIENSSSAVKWAVKHKVPCIGELELGYAFCKGRIIAITGTNGKSTVTTLIGHILKASGADTAVCGNIGNSLCGEAQRIGEKTWVVLEVSSAQLERTSSFRPHIAVILNITDDHMDRYRSFYEYFNEKLKVFANQGKDDFLVLNYDAENLRRLKGLAQSKALFYAKESPPVSGYRIAAFTREGKIYCSHDGAVREIMPVSDIKLSGVHNLENVLASCLASTLADVEPGFIRSAVSGFTGLEHRFETVGTIDGVEYIDDSKGTTVDSTRRALESCTKPVVLIAGGKDKKSDYSKIRDAVADRVSHLVLIGEAANAIKKAVGGLAPTDMAKTMKEAVETGRRVAKDGWIVLLSPMCSSFDMYKNYKERGDDFRRAVESLKSGQHTVKS